MIDKDALLAKRERAFETAAVKVIDITIGKTVVYLLQQQQEVNLAAIIKLLETAVTDNRPSHYPITVHEAKAALEFIQKHSV